jgi:hypothetical protein
MTAKGSGTDQAASQAGAEWAADTARTTAGLTKELNAVSVAVLRKLLG